MYPKIRVDKLHADGSPRASWEAYRIDDHEDTVRVWTPAGTPRIHVNGRWMPDGTLLTTWSPRDRFVVHRYTVPAGTNVYVDIIRAVIVETARFAYVDLFVDVMLEGDHAWSKDEERLAELRPDEAATVLAVRDSLLRMAGQRDGPFARAHPRWTIPPDARSLPPGVELALS